MRTPRLPAVDWTDAPADLNGLVRFGERRNLVPARVPSRFKRSLIMCKKHLSFMQYYLIIVPWWWFNMDWNMEEYLTLRLLMSYIYIYIYIYDISSLRINAVTWYKRPMENIVHSVAWLLWIDCWLCTEITTYIFLKLGCFRRNVAVEPYDQVWTKMHRSLLVWVLYGCESELFRFGTNNCIPSTFNVSLFHYLLPGQRVFWVHITTGRNKFEYRVELRATARRYVMLIHLFSRPKYLCSYQDKYFFRLPFRGM